VSSTYLAKSTQALEEEQAEGAGLSRTRSLGIGDSALELLVTASWWARKTRSCDQLALLHT